MIKILKNNIFTDPPHIYKEEAFDKIDVDKIYENWNNVEHIRWKEFFTKYKLTLLDKVKNTESYQYIGTEKLVGFIFFKDRADIRNITVKFNDVVRPYKLNSLLVLPTSQIITFLEKKESNFEKCFLVVNFDKNFLDTIKRIFRI
jgi:hypothetical protein